MSAFVPPAIQLSGREARVPLDREAAGVEFDTVFRNRPDDILSIAMRHGAHKDLEDLLGCRVQVVTEEGLYWLLRERILNEAEAL